MKIFLLELFLI